MLVAVFFCSETFVKVSPLSVPVLANHWYWHSFFMPVQHWRASAQSTIPLPIICDFIYLVIFVPMTQEFKTKLI